ncbi:hypothetical protein ACFFSH_39900 [Streptomyces filamentosus]|uniref:Uncharacterized protein n=1 Tax=Streptomyces filamentosus TaxID=67294 RepID=A0A919BBA4_STRFL|nr:hypothetical protein [Streptomyces filamentosus]GHF76932.1 hypothetical protein GCM10017667_00190 [Streptomyces filamentosus]
MATQKSNGTRVPATENSLTPARLLSTPLADLLAEVDAEVTEAPSEYGDAFEGVFIKPYIGPIQIVLPKARNAAHRDVMARVLVGRLLGTDLAPLPSSLESRSFGGVR